MPPAEARFEDEGRGFEARVSAQGPERAICVIRPTLIAAREDSLDLTDERPRPQLDRRGFLKRFKESVAVAALREQQMAIAVIHVDGIADIGQVIAAEIAERVMSVAILRLPAGYRGTMPAALVVPGPVEREPAGAGAGERGPRGHRSLCHGAVRQPARTGGYRGYASFI